MAKNITIFYAEDSAYFERENGIQRFEEVQVGFDEDFIEIRDDDEMKKIPRSAVEKYDMEVVE